jgi:glycosyltransferase involved in cell wall biosynthesis
MFKVADYLIQCQAERLPAGAAQLRPLDTRGATSPAFSLWVLLTAVGKIARGRLQGGLAGVHVNMAERMSLFRKGTVIVVCAVLGVPTVLHLHAQMASFFGRLPAGLRWLTRWVFSLPEAVIVIGPAAKSFVTETLHVPVDRVRMIINGVPEPQQASGLAPAGAPRRALFVGNLSDRKGVPDLLAALADPALSSTRLQVTIVGGGNVAAYQAMAQKLGVDAVVRFEGWCDQKKVSGFLANCDLLVLPSHDEVLPLAILEALAHGVAVVTTAVGEIPSLLTDCVDAVFVEAGDAASIAAGIQKVLEEPGLRQSLARNGRALYMQHFCLSSFFSNVASVHQRHFGIAGRLREGLLPAQDSQALRGEMQDATVLE